MKTEVSQSTLLLTYPLPVSMRKSFIRLAVSNLSPDYIKGVENTGKHPTPTPGGRPYYKRFINEILIGKQNFHNGGIGIVKEDNAGKICSNAISSYCVLKDNLNFIFYHISRPTYYSKVGDLIGGTGQKEISKATLLGLGISIPCQEEQTKIADFLSAIDEKIETERQILNAYTGQKKYLLANMFI
jgi:type I restriction enzyme S subunit